MEESEALFELTMERFSFCAINFCFHFWYKVLNKIGKEIKSSDNMDETTVNEGYKTSMFPPTDEENKNIKLERW